MTDKTEKHTKDATASVQLGDLTKQLIDCRAKAGMDIEKAAESMHLSRSLINALETEAFDELPEPPYIRGYLRSYAKLAGIDPTPLIRTYEILRGADPDANEHHFAPATSMNRVTAPAISPEAMRMLGIAGLVVFLGLLSMIPAVRNWAQDVWMTFSAQTQQSLQARTENERLRPNLGGVVSNNPSLADRPPLGDEINLPVSNTTSTTVESSEAIATQSNQSNAATSVEDTKSDTSQAKAVDADQPKTIADAKAATQIASANSDKKEKAATTPEKTKNKPDTNASTLENEPSQTPAATTKQAEAKKKTESTEPKQPIDGSVAVRLEFIDEVWMEVRDKRGKKLFSALNSGGTIKEFSAYTPLSFKIGNARGVALYLNGQFYDTKPFITGGTVAKFRVE